MKTFNLQKLCWGVVQLWVVLASLVCGCRLSKIAFPDSLLQRAQSVFLDVAGLLDSDKSNTTGG